MGWTTMKARSCELCRAEASLFCPFDSAFLCWNCDAKVHAANFLVARHVRRTVCSKCKGFSGDRISGAGSWPVPMFCRSCSPPEEVDSLSSSSASFSSTESCVTPRKNKIGSARCMIKRVLSSNSVNNSSGDRSPAMNHGEVTSGTFRKNDTPRGKARTISRVRFKVDSKTEDIFGKWCSELGLGGDGVVRMACQAFRVCWEELTYLPSRVCLAASLWVSLRLCVDRSASSCAVLRRLEQISGVPAKLILVAETRLARTSGMRKKKQLLFDHLAPEQEEDWAECSASTTT